MSQKQRNIVITAVIIFITILLCWGIIAFSLNIGNRFLNQETPSPEATIDAHPGLFILNVLPESPGARAGLQAGQIILEADGATTNSPIDLQNVLEGKQSGDPINLVLLVDGERRQAELFRGLEPPYLGLEITANDPNVTLPLATPTFEAEIPEEETAVSPTPDISQLGLAQISSVIPDTPASAAGFEAGDVITIIDDKAILTTAELTEILGEKAAGQTITITFRRGPDTLMRSVTLAPHPDDNERGFLGIELQTQ